VLDTAIAIGNPEGNGISATVGYVNVDSEYITMTGADGVTEVRFRVIRTDAAVNNGNSGGGLFNHKGELIGIVNAKMSTSTVDNIGYAIPSNVALYVANNIKHYCDGTDKECVYKCRIGITVTADKSYSEYDADTGKIYKKEIVKVISVTEGEAADGIIKANDILRAITIDGKSYTIDRSFKVVDSMLNAREGSSITVEVEREGQTLYLNIPITSDCLAAEK
jgi:serine protease Do